MYDSGAGDFQVTVGEHVRSENNPNKRDIEIIVSLFLICCIIYERKHKQLTGIGIKQNCFSFISKLSENLIISFPQYYTQYVCCNPVTTICCVFQDVINHENYAPLTLANDISLIVLAEDVSWTNDAYNPACSPSLGVDAYAGEQTTVSGWGTLRSGSFIAALKPYAIFSK